MKLFRFLLPSFEKPVQPPRYLNIESESRDFRGVGTVLLLAASCGVAFALWEPSHQVTTPFVTSSVSRSAPVTASTTAGPETNASATADAEDDQVAPTVKLSTLCSQRTTARRDCASAKAFKDARVNAPESEPVPAPAKESKSAAVAAKASSNARTSPTAPAVAQPVAAVTPSDAGAAQPDVTPATKAASAAKAKRPRPADEAPVERLVRVYDQLMPDGRRVPVYRRAGSGGYETGTIVDGEYRAVRGANLDPPRERYFGLQ